VTTTAATLCLRRGGVGVAVFARLCSSRGRKRQSGDSCGKEKPGHRNFSFRTGKTARSPHRSNC
jgi:hypothetical protein